MSIVLYLKNNLDERIKRVLSLQFKVRSNHIRQLIDSSVSVGRLLQKIFYTSVHIGHTFLYYAPLSGSILFAQDNVYTRSRFPGVNVQYMAGQLIISVLRYSCQRKEYEKQQEPESSCCFFVHSFKVPTAFVRHLLK